MAWIEVNGDSGATDWELGSENAELKRQMRKLEIKNGAMKDLEVSKRVLEFRNKKIAETSARLLASDRRFDWLESSSTAKAEEVRHLELLKEVS